MNPSPMNNARNLGIVKYVYVHCVYVCTYVYIYMYAYKYIIFEWWMLISQLIFYPLSLDAFA